MPMIGCEKLGKDDFKPVDKSQGGLLSLWKWITKKETCFNTRIKVSDKTKAMVSAPIKKLSAEDLKELNCIDIQKIQNFNNINQKKQPDINQVAKDKLYLKENRAQNKYVMPNSLITRKSVNNSKVDTRLVVTTSSTSIYLKHSEENCINSKSPCIVGVKSHKSDVNNLIDKVGKEVNKKVISQSKPHHRSLLTETVPSKILQSNTQQKEQRKAHRFSKSNHTRQTNSNNQLNKKVDKKVIAMEVKKNKSLEDTKIKMNGTSKLKVLKRSPARHDLSNNYSPIQYSETKKNVVCKIYSTNKKLSKSPRKAHRKVTKKKSKNVLSSSSEKNLKTGYPFENFKDSLNNFSLDLSTSISIEPFNDKAKYFKTFPYSVAQPEITMNKNPLGGYGNSLINLEINGVTFKPKDPNNHSGELNSTTKQQQKSSTHEINKAQTNHLNSTLHNGSVPSYTGININELNSKNQNMIQSIASLDTKRCVTEIFAGKDLLKSDYDLSKTDDKINKKPTLKNLSLQFNKEIIQSCDEFDNTSRKNIFSDERARLENQNKNVSKELIMPSSEKIKDSQIKITILVEDNLKTLVDIKSNIVTNNTKECTDTFENFCNIHTRNWATVEANGNESKLNELEHPIQKVNNESMLKSCLEATNQRINNEIENNSMNVNEVISNMTLNTPKPKNSIEDRSLQFGNLGRYLYKKERKHLELNLNKQNPYGVNDSLLKINISKKHVAFENDNSKINEEPNRSEIKENWDFDCGTAESAVRDDNNLTNSSQINMPADNEIKTVDSVKAQQDFNDGKLEEKRFFRIINEKQEEINPDNKHIITDTRKRSCRYSLTLSQEPTFEESEDEMSTKNMVYIEHQSDKGDNIEIKSPDFMCYNINEITMYENDNVSPISAWLNINDNRSDYEPGKCIKTSSVLVQTDWSLIGTSGHCLNEIPKHSISCQTESVMDNIDLFKNEITDNSDSSKCLMNDHSKLVSCDPITTDSEESNNTPSNNPLNLRITAYEQNGILSRSNVVKIKHQCTARCFYSISQESILSSASQLDCTISTAVQDHNFILTKTEVCGSTSSDHVPNLSTIEEEIGSNDNHPYVNFWKDAMEKREPEDKEIKVNPNKSEDCRTTSTLFVVDVQSETNNTDANNTNKSFFDKLDLSIQKCFPKEPITRTDSRQGKINSLSDSDEIEQDCLFHASNTSNVCCVDCKGCAALNKESSSD